MSKARVLAIDDQPYFRRFVEDLLAEEGFEVHAAASAQEALELIEAEGPFDLVVTVCDNAKESCPTLAGAQQVLHWPFDDPADATGSEEQKMEVFRRVRDEISNKIRAYLR